MTATVMAPDDIRRALTRIAHEILERDKGAADVVLVGIADRGDDLARRLAAEVSRIEGVEIPVGVLDITFYRDDIGLRAEAPEVHETRIGFDVSGQGRGARRRRVVHRPDDPLGDGRAHGPRSAAQDPAGRPGGPRAPGAPDPRRLRRQERADEP
jgi:pyrimidine operon attenuation protein/uracil phosphoribosyltransferase